MNRATPNQTRRALEVVEVFKKAGIRFIPVPVFDDEDEKSVALYADEKLDKIIHMAEQNEVRNAND